MCLTYTHIPPQTEIILPRNPKLSTILMPVCHPLGSSFGFIWFPAFIYFGGKKGTVTAPGFMYISYISSS